MTKVGEAAAKKTGETAETVDEAAEMTKVGVAVAEKTGETAETVAAEMTDVAAEKTGVAAEKTGVAADAIVVAEMERERAGRGEREYDDGGGGECDDEWVRAHDNDDDGGGGGDDVDEEEETEEAEAARRAALAKRLEKLELTVHTAADESSVEVCRPVLAVLIDDPVARELVSMGLPRGPALEAARATADASGAGGGGTAGGPGGCDGTPEDRHLARLNLEAAAVTAALHHLYVAGGLYRAAAGALVAADGDPEAVAVAFEERADELEVLRSIYDERLEVYNDSGSSATVWRPVQSRARAHTRTGNVYHSSIAVFLFFFFLWGGGLETKRTATRCLH